jgi:DNA-binding NarL/FixJ family response regulator
VWDVGSLAELGPMLEMQPVDVVLMDLNLGPEQDALAKTRDIREKFDNVRVIVISGSLDFEWAAASRAAGANGYLPKDLPVEDMMAAIRGLVSPNFGKVGFSDLLSDGPRREGTYGSLARLLTPRERQVLGELRRGRTNKEIAHRLGVSTTTINKHVQQVLKKLHVPNRAQAVLLVDTHVRGRPYVGGDSRRVESTSTIGPGKSKRAG